MGILDESVAEARRERVEQLLAWMPETQGFARFGVAVIVCEYVRSRTCEVVSRVDLAEKLRAMAKDCEGAEAERDHWLRTAREVTTATGVPVLVIGAKEAALEIVTPWLASA